MEPLIIVGAVAVIAALSAVQRHQRSARRGQPPHSRPRDTRTSRGAYPGDYTGRVEVRYAARRDGEPDPGEIVWTWVPFQEDHSRGKDRPVLLIGRDGPWLLGLQLSSKDHDRYAAQEAQRGRHWLGIGAGPWDAQRRPSAVRLDRIVRVDPLAVRREGAMLSRRMFDEVARSLSALHHW
ncbi:type II toxin-antitoxin system PemK/MazF family toxin [Demequina aestuarii]|uniref:type II toxin-antitoxin system PemK/MazF family toxin n=1 Tax=Demequina aestuarii TaxID=327095 RepID=UPI0007827637|nr:type II toxin-antitoxin system PemK/MazF family toxin [Demequina aestuarii]